jgi:hypothetical protein
MVRCIRAEACHCGTSDQPPNGATTKCLHSVWHLKYKACSSRPGTSSCMYYELDGIHECQDKEYE